MATYIIGDIHGCFQTFLTLLDAIEFDQNQDKLWFVGDLVNNGTQSAQMVRWVKTHQACCILVLGNHDLHMLAVWSGAVQARSKDTFNDLLGASDAGALCDWLRKQPLYHQEGPHVLVHAGLHPSWRLDDAENISKKINKALRKDDCAQFFEHMYGNTPKHPAHIKSKIQNLRFGINVMTRMRVLESDSSLDFKFKSTLSNVPQDLIPWFRLPTITRPQHTIYFGHWSALGLHKENNAHCLDSGCTWGKTLSALCLETQHITQVQAIDAPFESPQ